MENIRIMLVDDHDVVRTGLRAEVTTTSRYTALRCNVFPALCAFQLWYTVKKCAERTEARNTAERMLREHAKDLREKAEVEVNI